jgi:acetoin utilization protein AcuB
MMNEAVSTIMTKELITIHPDDKLSMVLEAFKTKKIHHLPVIEDGKLVGLITTSDLMWLNRSFDDYSSIQVSDVMTRKLATLEPSAKIGTAAEIFLENWFHALPIVDENELLVGIVTSFDILRYNYNKAYPK